VIFIRFMTLSGNNLSASLTVKDLNASKNWYCDILGFVVDKNHERGGKLLAVSLRAGEVRVLLTQDDGAKGLDRVKGEGFSMMITTGDDLDALVQRIKDAGVTLDTELMDTPWGTRAFRVRDPDGFRYTISS